MTIQKLITDKSVCKKEITQKLKIKKSRAIGIICPHILMDSDMIDGLQHCNADFICFEKSQASDNIHYLEKSEVSKHISGFDFLLCTEETSNLQEYLSQGVVPIIYEKNCLSSFLQEFNPIKGEGNCFLYESQSKWSIYGALVKYLENYKFPYDNKNLVKNTINI